jgi:hypothetical protein
MAGLARVYSEFSGKGKLPVCPHTQRRDKRLLPGFVQFEGEDSGIGLEVGVGGEDGPVASDGDSANQDVGDGYDDSAGAAVVAGFGGGFIIGRASGLVREGAEDCAELFVLAGRLDAG